VKLFFSRGERKRDVFKRRKLKSSFSLISALKYDQYAYCKLSQHYNTLELLITGYIKTEKTFSNVQSMGRAVCQHPPVPTSLPTSLPPPPMPIPGMGNICSPVILLAVLCIVPCLPTWVTARQSVSKRFCFCSSCCSCCCCCLLQLLLLHFFGKLLLTKGNYKN